MDTLNEIDDTGFAAAKAVDLVLAYSSRNATIFRNYADILYAHIIDFIAPHKDKILEQLVTAAATPHAPIKTKIWNYSVLYPTDGKVLSPDEMAGYTNRGFHTVLFDDGRPMSVDAIFRNTDLAWRLAFTFGSKFRVSFYRDYTKSLSYDYTSYEIAVCLHYHPDGLLPHAEEKLVAAYKGVCDRQLHVGKDVNLLGRY